MQKPFTFRNLLIIIVLLLLGLICCLKGCFSEEPIANIEKIQIKFYFKEKPSPEYLSSLKTYFKNQLHSDLKIKDTLSNFSLIQKVDCPSCNIRNTCYVCVTTYVKRDPPQNIWGYVLENQREYYYQLINLINMDKELRSNFVRHDVLFQEERK